MELIGMDSGGISCRGEDYESPRRADESRRRENVEYSGWSCLIAQGKKMWYDRVSEASWSEEDKTTRERKQ